MRQRAGPDVAAVHLGCDAGGHPSTVLSAAVPSSPPHPLDAQLAAGADRGASPRPPAAPGVLAAITDADVVLLAPSNPVVSVAPILAVDGVREALAARPGPRVGVSPIIGGRVVRGMADRLLPVVGIGVGAAAVGAAHAGLLDAWVMDDVDRDTEVDPLSTAGVAPSWTDTRLDDPTVAAACAQHALDIAFGPTPRRAAPPRCRPRPSGTVTSAPSPRPSAGSLAEVTGLEVTGLEGTGLEVTGVTTPHRFVAGDDVAGVLRASLATRRRPPARRRRPVRGLEGGGARRGTCGRRRRRRPPSARPRARGSRRGGDRHRCWSPKRRWAT